MADNIETEGDWHWRNTMRPLKFFGLDARAAATFFLFIMHARWWTLYLCFVVTGVLYAVERMGYTVPSAFRALRSWLVGDYRPALMHTRRRGIIDYGE